MNQKLKFIIWLSLIIIMIFPLILSICSPSIFATFFSENTGLYFYSALLQANAAILSIVGVFYIFRIQSYQNSIDILKTPLLADRGHVTWPETIIKFESLSIKEKRKKVEGKEYPEQILSQLSTWTNLEEQAIHVKSLIKFPTLLLSIGIILYAIGLLLINKIHQFNGNSEFQILYVSFILELVTIFFVVKAILRAIK